MKIILFGNAGAGKSTLARKLMMQQNAARLSLDEVAFQGGVERRPIADSVSDVIRFITENEHWIIEECYADIIEPIMDCCDELIFLNPGVETCIAHYRARPWEPEKYSSAQEQDENLKNLIEWVRSYETRSDEYGLRRHRALYESFRGAKRELLDPSRYNASSQPTPASGRG